MKMLSISEIFYGSMYWVYVLGYYFIDHLAVHISEPEWPALKLVSEFFMIESQLIQDGSLHIIGRHFPADGIVSDFICFAITESFPDSSTRHLDCECIN